MLLNTKYIQELKEYLESDMFEQDFDYSSEDRRLEIMDFLDMLMDAADAADQAATKIIFRNLQVEPPTKDINQK